MLDGLFELISNLLNLFYSVVHDYALAIGLLTAVVMLVTTPLTLKATRSMIEMQRLQPELRRIQLQYRDDPQKRQEEMMRFYKEHEINPLGGCLPLLIQAPVFSVLYYVVRGLTTQSQFVGLQRSLSDYGIDPTVTDGFRPKYLDSSTELYQALLGQHEMVSAGMDLARSPSEAIGSGFVTGLPYLALVGTIALLSWLQQRQIMGRNPNQQMTQQQRVMMVVGPVMYVFFAFSLPAAIGVYFLVSTAWRVAQQAYITQRHYRGEDSIGAQALKAAAQARESRDSEGGGGGLLGGLFGGGARDGGKAAGKGGAEARTTAKAGGARKGGAGKGSANGSRKVSGKASQNGSGRGKGAGGTSGRARPAGASASRPHPRSRKKKKKRK